MLGSKRTHGCFLVLVAFLLFVPLGKAQLELGTTLGGSTYDGDLAPQKLSNHMDRLKTSFGLFVRRDLGSHFGARVFYQHCQLLGADALRNSTTERNLAFQTDIDELGLLLELYPLGNSHRVKPYFFGGASLYHFDPYTFYRGEKVHLQPLGTEGQGREGFGARYALTRIAVPIGAGMKTRVWQQLSVGFEVSTRLTFFDHLDDVGGNYVSPKTLSPDGTNPLAALLADRTRELESSVPSAPLGALRGDPSDNDWFYVASFTLSWTLKPGAIRSIFRHRSPHEKCYEF